MKTTATLAEFVVRTTSSEIPDKARIETKRAILDVIGTALAGSAEDCGRLITEFVKSESAPTGEATVLGSGFKTAPSMAALANGTMSHALDYDDVGLGIGHPSVAVVPAALATAEAIGASGQELIDAVIFGFEVAGRIGRGAGPTAYSTGFHGTSIYGVFGAAAAAGRLLGLDVDQMRNAFGICGSEASGVRANFGTMTKPLHAGETCRAGVMAATLAKKGYTGDPNIIETRVGYGDSILGKDAYNAEAMTAGLGEEFLVSRGVDIKKYPCCYLTHPSIDGVLNMLSRHELVDDDIEHITVQSTPHAEGVLLYMRPENGLQGKFSLPYTVAAAMLDHGVKRSTFTDERLARPEMQAALDKVTVNWTRGREVGPGAALHVRTKDGSAIDWEQKTIKGSAADPLSRSELVDKFIDNAIVAMSESDARRVVAIVESLEQERNVRALTSALSEARGTAAS